MAIFRIDNLSIFVLSLNLMDMSDKIFNRLLQFSLFFMALWFFGNLYEELVLIPNQLTDCYGKLQHWQQFFTITNPMYFYVPFTQLAVIVICILHFRVSDIKQKEFLKKASVFGVSAIIITGIIVTQINLKIFFGDLNKYKDQLFTLSVIWLIGNAIRLYLVWNSLYYIFKTYILRQGKTSNTEHDLLSN